MSKSAIYILISTAFSLLFSVYLFFFLENENAKLYGIYVGIWVPSLLSAYCVLLTSKNINKND